MRFLFARVYSSIFGFFHDKAKFNIRGLGFFLRRLNKDHVVDINNLKMYMCSDIGTSYARLISGDWAEPETHVFLNSTLEILGESTFIDIGANVGEMVLSVAKNTNLKNVFAFEPDPVCSKVININNIINDISNCFIYQKALSDSAGQLLLTAAGTPQASLTNVVNRDDPSQIAVDVTTLDDVIERDNLQQKIGGSETIILVDVEGHEPQVLAGAKYFIDSNRPVVIFEFNSTSKQFFCLDDIKSNLPSGYEIFRLNRSGHLDTDLSSTWNCVALDTASVSHQLIRKRDI